MKKAQWPPMFDWMTEELAERCRKLVFATASEYGIPPVYITAHVRFARSDAARVEVWRVMINEWGMLRSHVAAIYGRDIRRLRGSVLKKTVTSR